MLDIGHNILGCIHIEEIDGDVILLNDYCCFKINIFVTATHDGLYHSFGKEELNYQFKCQSPKDTKEWVEHINEICHLYNENVYIIYY